MYSVRANILYGLVVLIPIGLLALVGYYIYGFWTLVFLPFSDQLGLTTTQARLAAVAVAIPAFFAISYLVGLLVRTRLGTVSFNAIESGLLSQIPGYGIVANLLRGFADRKSNYPAALIQLGDGIAVPGFVMEDDGGTSVTVLVPLAPIVTMGQVYIVDRHYVEILPDATLDTANRIAQWGIGFQDLVSKTSPKTKL